MLAESAVKSVGDLGGLLDDLLDVTQSASTLGKPACGDIAEGKKTIPIMLLREGLNASELARLDALRDATIGDDDREWITTRVEETGAREQTETLAREYTNEALQHLAELPPSEYREAMEGLVEFVLVRAM